MGVKHLRQALCESDFDWQSIINDALIAILANFLISPNEELQSDAAWCLTNIATGEHDQTGKVLVAIPNVIQILSHKTCSESIKEQVCWIIGNIAGDCDEYRRVLFANGCLPSLVRFLLSSSASGFFGGARTAAWATSNLARGSSTTASFVETGESASLIRLICCADAEVSTEVCWVFAFLTAKEEAQVQVLLREGLIEALLQRAQSIDPLSPSAVPLVRCLGNLTSGPIEWIDEMLSSEVRTALLVQTMLHLTQGGGGVHRAVLKESLWVTSNVLGGRPQHRQTVLACAGVDLLVNLTSAFCGDEFSLQREGLLALQSACLDDAALEHMMCGTMSPAVCAQLVRSLKMHSDCEVSAACIDILHAAYSRSVVARQEVLGRCVSLGLMDALDSLQYGQGGEEVGQRAASLADLLYIAMEDEEEEVAEAVVEVQAPPVISMGRGQHLARPAWMTPS